MTHLDTLGRFMCSRFVVSGEIMFAGSLVNLSACPDRGWKTTTSYHFDSVIQTTGCLLSPWRYNSPLRVCLIGLLLLNISSFVLMSADEYRPGKIMESDNPRFPITQELSTPWFWWWTVQQITFLFFSISLSLSLFSIASTTISAIRRKMQYRIIPMIASYVLCL